MSELFYGEELTDRAIHPCFFGKQNTPDLDIKLSNPSCGDKLILYIKYSGNKVIEATFEGAGCAISKASADILCEEIIGKTKQEIEKLTTTWHKNPLLGHILQMPARVKCVSLAWESLEKITFSFPNS